MSDLCGSSRCCAASIAAGVPEYLKAKSRSTGKSGDGPRVMRYLESICGPSERAFGAEEHQAFRGTPVVPRVNVYDGVA